MLTWPSPKSLWLAQLDPIVPTNPINKDLTIDIGIAGGGYSGLWSAYYLKKADPSLRIAIFEAKFAGFGASGRNGGWASGLFASSKQAIEDRYGRQSAIALYRSLNDSIDEIGKVTQSEGIEADFHKGGTIMVARNKAQLDRASAFVQSEQNFGFGEDVQLLDGAQAQKRLNATDTLGGAFTKQCARIHPAKLARGLAQVVLGMGVQIYEQSLVTKIGPHDLQVNGRGIKCEVAIDALEGYRSLLSGQSRVTTPIYSLMIATERLSDQQFAEIGLGDCETFADERNLIVYGQRSADNRIVFGGRGAPYHFKSTISPKFDYQSDVFDNLKSALIELFPSLRATKIQYQWGGPLGVPRDFFSFVRFDLGRGIASLGGYVGDGVTTSNLAGRTLSDLILNKKSDLSELCIVNHKARKWEMEPLRYLGVNAGLWAAAQSDKYDNQGLPQPLTATILNRLTGQ